MLTGLTERAAVRFAIKIHATVPRVFFRKQVTMRWKGYGTLQSAESINGPWADVPNERSPYLTELGSSARFYRVRQ